MSDTPIAPQNESILRTVRQHVVGYDAANPAFDKQLIDHTNAALWRLNQLNVGTRGFRITDEKETWAVSHTNAHKFDDVCRQKSLDARRESAKENEYNRRAYAAIKLALGSMGYNALADYLNENNFTTAKGGVWRGNQVKRLVALYS